jgi:hypothetical protein
MTNDKILEVLVRYEEKLSEIDCEPSKSFYEPTEIFPTSALVFLFRESSVVIVIGLPKVGKSRLIESLHRLVPHLRSSTIGLVDVNDAVKIRKRIKDYRKDAEQKGTSIAIEHTSRKAGEVRGSMMIEALADAIIEVSATETPNVVRVSYLWRHYNPRELLVRL